MFCILKNIVKNNNVNSSSKTLDDVLHDVFSVTRPSRSDSGKLIHLLSHWVCVGTYLTDLTLVSEEDEEDEEDEKDGEVIKWLKLSNDKS